jgi:predicted dehydrogenase
MLAVPSPFRISGHNLVILSKNDTEKQDLFKIDNRFQDLVDDFARSIIDKKPPLITPAESCQIVATLEGMLASARSGYPVRINPAVDGLVKPAGL